MDHHIEPFIGRHRIVVLRGDQSRDFLDAFIGVRIAQLHHLKQRLIASGLHRLFRGEPLDEVFEMGQEPGVGVRLFIQVDLKMVRDDCQDRLGRFRHLGDKV